MVDKDLLTMTVSPELDGERLDKYLRAALPEASRAEVRRLLAAEAVRVGGRVRRKGGATVREGDQIEVEGFVAPTAWSPLPDPSLEVSILYEDRDLVAVNKPSGVACHPLRPDELGTVASSMIARYPELARAGEVRREAGLIHRLDEVTSGVLIFARRRSAFRGLVAQLRGEGGAIKRYHALVEGDASDLKRITRPLRSRARRMVALEEGAEGRDVLTAQTEIKQVRRFGRFTLVEATIGAGRRHQIRAHLAAEGHPIAGDELYGATLELPGLERPFLHARRVEMQRPATGEELLIEAPLPPDLAALLEALGAQDPGS